MELEMIKELYEEVKCGEIDESKLVITLDNDCITPITHYK